MRRITLSALGIMILGTAAPAGAASASGGAACDKGQTIDNLLAGQLKWQVSSPLVCPTERPADPPYSMKDPTVVFYEGRWHLFCTIRSPKRTHQIEYLSFGGWKDADAAERHVLKLSDGYFCAPQVFYLAAQRKWYMICQVADESRKPSLQPAYSTTDDIAEPNSWSKPVLLFDAQPDNVQMWIDFWVICDATRAHLFFTSLDGRMWRSQTKLDDFPQGWGRPGVAISGDIFEASHTYRLKGLQKFLTVVEAQAGERRYYKAYIADVLDGPWLALAATQDRPFAGPANTTDEGGHWTDSFSHGELVRDGFDQTLTVDPAKLRFLFQGVSDERKTGKKYGEIPWCLGMLEPAE